MEKARMLGTEQVVVGGTEGGRSPTGVPPTTAAAAQGAPAAGNGKLIPDPAVSEKPVRRRFTAEYKLRILHEADRCTASGQLGALLRREGLFSSHLSIWRQQRDEGTLVGLDFCGKFFHWQNHEHHHWGLGLLTPATVHFGQADTVLAGRQAVLTAAHVTPYATTTARH